MISDTPLIHHPLFEKVMKMIKSFPLIRSCFAVVALVSSFSLLGCSATGSNANGQGGNATSNQNGTAIAVNPNGSQATNVVAPAPTRPASHRRTPLQMEEAAASQSPLKGIEAPLFTLMNNEDKPVALKDLRGKWTILYFYPKDDTPGCTCQATEFTDILRRFHMLNAQVYGISPDNPSSHRFFIAKYKLNLPLLSDDGHKVMKQYGSYVPFKVGAIEGHRVIRSTFLIDPKGKVAYHWPEVIPEGHAARVRDKLAAIQKQGSGS